jgi:MinD superfamily P-loop ATPase
MILSIASGKGGTGKTLITTSLAVSLSQREPVQVLDCDVEEPNARIFLKPEINVNETVNVAVPELAKEKCDYCGLCARVCAYNAIAAAPQAVLIFPELCHSCGACSYLCPTGALIEKERGIGEVAIGHRNGIDFVEGRLAVGEVLAVPVIKKVRKLADEQRLVLIDAPPGTSCPVIESVNGSDFCLLVTEPTPFGLNDLALAVGMATELGVPCGVIINRAGSGDRLIEDYCRKEAIPVLLKIPLERQIAALYSRGVTLAEGLPEWQPKFISLYDSVKGMVDERVTGNIR